MMTFMLLGLVIKAQTPVKHIVGEKFGGGVVISVTADGLKGLIAESQDQGTCDWNAATALIAKPENHSTDAKAYTDWRLPSKDEAVLLFNLKAKVGSLTGLYWTSTNGKGMVYVLDAATGKFAPVAKSATNKVRSVRNF